MVDPDVVLQAIGNPVRLRILALVAGQAMSGAQLARELDIKPASAGYHLRRLEAAELVEVAQVRSTRGGRERLYRQRPPAQGPVGEQQPSDLRHWQGLLSAVCVELQRRGQQTADRPKWVFDAELWVAERDLEAARRSLDEALHGLQAAAGGPSADRTVRVSATALLFALDQGSDGSAA